MNPFKYKLTVIFILSGVCVQTSVLMFVIQRDLVQMEHVKYIMSGSVVAHHLTVQGMSHYGGEIFKTCVNQLWGPPSFLCSDTGSFPAAKKLGHTTHLMPRLKNKYVYTSSPPLCLHGML